MSWRALRITTSAGADSISSALFEAGAQAVQETQDGIVTHFPPGADVEHIAAMIARIDPQATVTIGDTPELDPALLHGSVSVQRLGAITIAPPWDAAGIDEAGLVIIDPAMGFGTGEHPTTRGVIRLLQTVIEPGDTVADLGAGSAILSIAAAKLGAVRVFAIENDALAIGNAEENVIGNRTADRVTVIEGDAAALLPLVGPVSLVLANIISSILLQLMPVIHDGVRPGGHAILSGILRTERKDILASAESAGFVSLNEDSEGEWWSVLLKRP